MGKSSDWCGDLLGALEPRIMFDGAAAAEAAHAVCQAEAQDAGDHDATPDNHADGGVGPVEPQDSAPTLPKSR